MNTELTQNLKCVVLNGGIEKWVDGDRAEMVRRAVESNQKFIDIGGELINTFNIVGIFTAKTMEDKQHRQNGQYFCSKGVWHDKFEKCDCREQLTPKKGYVEGIGEVEIAQYK